MRISTAAATAALLALGLASPAGATGTIDRAIPDNATLPGFSNWFWYQQMAETFTPSRTGQLDRVALFEGANGVPSAVANGPAFTLQIWKVDTSQPTLTASGTPASYRFLSWTGTPNWRNFDLSPAVQVTSGTQYAIVVLAVRSFTVKWSYMTAWPYSGSAQWTCCDLNNKWMAGVADTNFAYQTYVTGGTPPASNTPPSITEAQAAVHTNEGTAPTNTGTYSDGDGDNVALSASSGTLTRTGTNNGSWAWTQPASDEAPTQSVTITANDGHNAAVTTQFTVDVAATAPAVTIASTTSRVASSGTAATSEGTALSFTGAALSASASDNQAGFTYSWSVTKDGAAYDASGAGTSFNFTPNDEGTYVVTLSATDDGSMTGSASTTAVVLDVAPTASIDSVTPAQTAPALFLPNEMITFTGSFTDPGTFDPHTATWDFGDGSPTATGWTVTHAFAAAGPYSVTLTVSEGEDLATGTSTFKVTVQTPAQALSTVANYVRGLSVLNAGQKNSLIAKLDAAAASADRGDAKASSNQLDAFLNEVRADVNSGKLSPTEAANLTNAAHTVQGALGTYNRFLGWWPLGI